MGRNTGQISFESTPILNYDRGGEVLVTELSAKRGEKRKVGQEDKGKRRLGSPIRKRTKITE